MKKKKIKTSRKKALELLENLPDLKEGCLAMPSGEINHRTCPFSYEINNQIIECDCDDIQYQSCLDDI